MFVLPAVFHHLLFSAYVLQERFLKITGITAIAASGLPLLRSFNSKARFEA
jgi:hypothetical protein